MSVKEYSLTFPQLSHFALVMIANSKALMSMLMSGVSKDVFKMFRIVMLVNNMDVSRLMANSQ